MRLQRVAAGLFATFAASVVPSVVAGDDSVTDYGVLAWIHDQQGGYVHPSQEFRLDAENGISGIFAAKPIKKGELLMEVPWSLIIESDDPNEEGPMCCGTVKAIAREMKKGNESFYAPYANYLNAQPDDHMPSAWSDAGKKLLQQIIGVGDEKNTIPPTEPVEWLSNDWYKHCRGSRADWLSAKAAMMVVQRSDDSLMVPGYDMYNHRNGRYFNTVCTTTEGEKHVTIASRDIEVGEQIHNSYNICKECGGRVRGYGTGEILRDYGFVEPMPQRWHYLDETMQFDLDVDGEGGLQLIWSRGMIPNTDDRIPCIVQLKRLIRRLEQVRNIDYRDGNQGIPEREWETAWAFQKANIQAMTVAIEALEAIEAGTADAKRVQAPPSKYNVSSFLDDVEHYDQLGWEFDDTEYIDTTCNNKEIMKFHDHVVVETLKTHYQNLNFGIHPDSKDVLMDLDNIVQISSNYRPQYHEYVTHAAARYVKNIKRVIFIGGGDSMLLHETLKYPDLELVVGLELDQMVVRKCFKWFMSQPHFDDPRVEWWFGDATKSLLLLSKEYWQSFDLVLVDLSETVMSLSVTKELDVFDALALLLKHEGVMVKNELYMEPFSKVFDYTQDLYYESPVICSQVLAFGSNKVDFMHDETYDHGIETFLYKNMHDPDTRHDLLHDYRRNDAQSQGKCGKLPEMEKLEEQSKSAGVIQIIEAEKTAAKLDESLADTFKHIIEREGFRLNGSPIYENGTLLIVMQEGYVVTRMFPEKKYCNIDVHLWGKFHKLKELSQSLTGAVGSGLVSSFRIVVGGMYGSDTWKNDREIVGPQIIQPRNCETEEHGEAPDMNEQFITAAVHESMSLVEKPEVTAVVVCADAEDCLATKLLSKYGKIRKVVKISTCPEMKADDADSRYDCEVAKTVELKTALGPDKTDLFVVDGSASYELVQIMNSILSRDDYRESSIADSNVFLVWSSNPVEEQYQRNFLDRYLKQHGSDPIARGEIWMQAGKGAVEFGVLSAGDRKINYNLPAVEAKLRETFNKKDNVEVGLRGIYGGLFEYEDNFEPNEFLQSDYDEKPGYAQYYGQKPLARHIVFQLEEAKGKEYGFSKDALNKAIQQSLDDLKFECTTNYAYPGLGDGTLLVCLNAYKGNIIVVWDGRKHVDISLYLLGEGNDTSEKFMGAMIHHTGRTLEVALRDDMPRGTGRVINFPEDMKTPEEVSIFYETLSERGEEQEDEDEPELDVDPSLGEL